MKNYEAYLKTLSPEKQELFKLLLSEKKAQEEQQRSIKLREDPDIYPLSYGQERLWFLDQWEPGNPAYNLPQAVMLTGTLDIEVLKSTLNTIVKRHETLRSRFVSEQGKPVLIVEPEWEIALPIIDLGAYAQAEQEQRVNAIIAEEALLAFDLARGPMIRTKLLRMSAARWIMLLTLHHIVSDGWSNGVLVKEIGIIYKALAARKPVPLPALAIQYADFAAWQRQRLTGGFLEKQVAYWQQQLQDAPEVMELPADKPHPSNQSYKGGRYYFSVPLSIVDALRKICQEQGTSLYMVLLAAFNVLLYKYTGRQDLLVGSPIANRNMADIEPLIGFFVNTIVLRTTLADENTFRELLQQVRRTTLEAQDHQELPFELLIEKLNVKRSTSHNPLFQVMFTLHNSPLPTLQTDALQITLLEIDPGTALFDLSLDLYETEKGLRGWFEYNTALYERETVVRAACHFNALLQDIASNTDKRIGGLHYLDEREKRMILHEFNPAVSTGGNDTTIGALFAAQVAKTPGSTAVVYEGSALSYARLDEQANRLANYLAARGVGVEQAVCICAKRSLELIVAVLAVIKAGAAYVPLDPTYPPERIQYILGDTRAAVLLTQTEFLPLLTGLVHKANPAPLLVDMDAEQENIGKAADVDPHITVYPENLVYIIYTSGSTGNPKGVMVTHKNLASIYSAWEEAYQLRTRVRSHLQMANFTFDVFNGDLARALLSGGKLVICPRELLLEPDKLYALMRKEQIDCAEFVPVVLRNLIDSFQGTDKSLDFMKIIICASDAWFGKDLLRFKKYCGKETKLLNSYGLTEATIDSAYLDTQEAAIADEQIVPIGRPFANTTCYILDGSLDPVPVGIPGGLYIGGLGVARGYVKRPDLTGGRFIPDPFSQQAGSVLYKTGDRARFLPDGSIEFLGRMDFQIKIRGFRIEPGEIEAVLTRHPAVRETVVVPHRENNGNLQLAAYTVKDPDNAVTGEELRAYLAGKLPAYMIPAVFMFIAAMPLTPSGKINRKALPAPVMNRAGLATAFVLPRNDTEAIICDIICAVLGMQKVGIHDDFFALGGHSLLAAQVMARINKAFKLALPMRALFDYTTTGKLARHIDGYNSGDKQTSRHVPPVVPVLRNGPLPLSFAQEQLWLIDQLAPANSAYLIPATVTVKGALDIAILKKSFDELIIRHEIFRTTYTVVDQQPMQVIAPPFPFPLQIIDVSDTAAPGAEADKILTQASMQPLDLAHGPLIRGTLIIKGAKDYAFLFLMHHIVIDEWSSGIVLSELRELYDAYAKNRQPVLSAKTLQYADYACWQRSWFKAGILEEKLDFWRRQLQGSPGLIDLPFDYPRPGVQTFRGAYQLLPLPKAVSQNMSALAHKSGVTVFMTMLAAFNALLYRYTGQTDLVVGTPIANRGQLETEDLVGYFLNTILIRTDVSDDPSFLTLLTRVRETCLDAYAYQDLHFERLVQYLSPRRDPGRNALFNVMFVYNPNFPMPEIDAGDLHVSYLPVSRQVTRLDLTMYLFDSYGADGGFSIQFNYNTDLFKHETITRMMHHFALLLEKMVSAPELPVSRHTLLSAAETRMIVDDWNDTGKHYTQNICLHQLFEAQADRTPGRTALVYAEQELTYRQLDAAANRLAHHLQDMGIKRGEYIAVYCGRSPEMIIALLGILKAGAAYIPLETSFPGERLAKIFTTLNIKQLITQAQHLEKIRKIEQVVTVLQNITCLDNAEIKSGGSQSDVLLAHNIKIRYWEQLAQCPEKRLELALPPEQLAYILFTSGSTGIPKGVMVQHKPVVNLIQWVNSTFGINADDRVLFITSLCFDLSVYDIFGILAAGGSLRIVPETILKEPEELCRLLFAEDITFWDSAPAALQQLTPFFGSCGSSRSRLRLVFLSGDWIPLKLPALVQDAFPHAGVISLGGATEAAIWSNYYPVKQVEPDWVSIPYGKPIQNARYYILDAHLNPCPIGVAGDLYIGGECLSIGYANDPALTAVKYLPDPYSALPGRVMYYTGDRARFRPDGNMEFLGRLDFQVKIRGYRIELGEIENALARHPDIRANLVIASAVEKGKRDKRLIAYLITHDKSALPVSQLRAFLLEHIPEYMLPAAFVTLDSFPLTSNGKIDLKALPLPGEVDLVVETAYLEPRNMVEETVAALWTEVLKVRRVGVKDNFFEAGGHSLMAIQILSRLSDTFQTELPLRELFEKPTVEAVANYIIAHEAVPGQAEKIAGLWKQVEMASEAELTEALAKSGADD